MGRYEQAIAFADETLTMDIADFGARYEKFMNLEAMGKSEDARLVKSELRRLLRDDAHNYLNLAWDYAGSGLYEEASYLLEEICSIQSGMTYPIAHYTLAYVYDKMGLTDKAEHERHLGGTAAPDYCFPNSLSDLMVLLHTVHKNPSDSKAHYYLGNLYYDKNERKRPYSTGRFPRALNINSPQLTAILRWLTTINVIMQRLHCNHLTELLNVIQTMPGCSTSSISCIKTGVSAQERLTKLQEHMHLVEQRDDLYLEYITLLNTQGNHHEALSLLLGRRFHPWEGGEGKATGQYTLALVELAKQENERQSYQEAISLLKRAFQYPENLGEGKLEGAQENNIHYELGMAYQGLGQLEEAVYHWKLASEGLEEPASAMYYNDQPPEMIFYQGLAWNQLNYSKEAKRRFNKLIDYAERHLFDDVKIDYFAVSLPDFLVFEDDLNKRNQTHCLFMLGLGLLGLGNKEEAKTI